MKKFFLFLGLFSVIGLFPNHLFCFNKKFQFKDVKNSKPQVFYNDSNYSVIAMGNGYLPKIEFNHIYFTGIKKPGSVNLASDIFQARDFAAKKSIENAIANIQSKIEKLPLDSIHSIRSFILANPRAKIPFSIFLRQYELLDQTYKGNMVQSKIKINFLSKRNQSNSFYKDLFSIYLQFQALDTIDDFPKFSRDLQPSAFTGLIIDLRGKKVDRALFPKIYDESGLIIYDFRKVDKDKISNYGLVQYSRQKNMSKIKRRVGLNPYYVVAISMVGEKYKSDPVILRKHSRTLLSHPRTLQALKNGRVLFLID